MTFNRIFSLSSSSEWTRQLLNDGRSFSTLIYSGFSQSRRRRLAIRADSVARTARKFSYERASRKTTTVGSKPAAVELFLAGRRIRRLNPSKLTAKILSDSQHARLDNLRPVSRPEDTLRAFQSRVFIEREYLVSPYVYTAPINMLMLLLSYYLRIGFSTEFLSPRHW